PYPMPGRSLLPILEEANPPGWDVIYGSHVFHEITMYYPMRMLRTRQNKYILNLASKLDFPFASDLYESKTWQGILRRSGGLGRPAPNGMFGPRSIAAYVHRPREELYDLEKDPGELRNLADDPKHAAILNDLRTRLKAWQEKTKDPWVVKYKYE